MKDLIILKSAHGGHWLRFAQAMQAMNEESRRIGEKIVISLQAEDTAFKTLATKLLESDIGIDHYFADSFDRLAVTVANDCVKRGTSTLNNLIREEKGYTDGFKGEDMLNEIKEHVQILTNARASTGRNILFYETEINNEGKNISQRDKGLYPVVVRNSGQKNILLMGKRHQLRPFFESKVPFRVIEVTINPFQELYSSDNHEVIRGMIGIAERETLEYSMRYNRIKQDDPLANTIREITEKVIAEQNAQPRFYLSPRDNPLTGLGISKLF